MLPGAVLAACVMSTGDYAALDRAVYRWCQAETREELLPLTVPTVRRIAAELDLAS
jgi:hypothetical protein